jgi:CDGSH-type Zn-finger protein
VAALPDGERVGPGGTASEQRLPGLRPRDAQWFTRGVAEDHGDRGLRTGRVGQARNVLRPSAADPGGPTDDEPVSLGDGGATITPYRDGPLIVRGDFRLVDQDGAEIDPGRTTVALCRCGKSGIKPFCDGSHKRAGFSAPSAPSRPRPAARIRSDARREDDVR